MHAGIYVHIPFCATKCYYCDFASKVASHNQFGPYIEALKQETSGYQQMFPALIMDTIYFGGGTPSILPANLLIEELAHLKESFRLGSEAEITIEANPGTVDMGKLSQLHHAGVTRLSFGVQAVQNRLLKQLGRMHTVEAAEDAIRIAHTAGFSNISIDLMYGLPEQTLGDLQASVEWALHQDIQHISIYGLQVEERTVFGKWQEQGRLKLPDEDSTLAMYEYLTERLPQEGFQRYEISNFALPGYASKHNLSYWQDKPYLGLGAGASGYYCNQRITNERQLEAYVAAIDAGRLPQAEIIKLDEQMHMEEFCFLALRMTSGIDKQKFFQTFNRKLESVYGMTIARLVKQKLLQETFSKVALTPLGMRYGNRVFEEFLLT